VAKRTSAVFIRESDGLLPQYVVRKIYEVTGGNATIVTGVGRTDVAHSITGTINRIADFLWRLGTMGFGLRLPSALRLVVQ